MKRKFYRTIGEIKEGQYGLFGRINGQYVTLKEITDKDGSVKWLVNESMEVFEVDQQKTQESQQK
jgi:hypothetical protein